ncbi:MAG: hypothetical protein AAGC73_07590, partial [Verrucomicrobiota bacterium]
MHFAESSKATITYSREALLEMGAVEESVLIPYINERIPCLVVPLSLVVEEAGGDASDTVTAESYDGYFSVFDPSFIEKYNPYVLVEIIETPAGVLQ